MIPDGPGVELERHLIPAPGVDLACWRRAGDGAERTVVWLHGAGGNHLMWHRQFDAFPGVDQLFLDVRGQGESSMHAGERASFEAAVDDIGLVLDASGIERAVLVGHSWGGNPAQEFAFRHPERVDGLVLVGTWGQHRRMSTGERRTIAAMSQLYRIVPWRALAAYSGKWASDDPTTRAAVAASIRATGRQVYLDLGTSAYAAVHEVDDYPAETPTLLIRGERDAAKALDPIYADIVAKNPAARTVVIAETGHQPMLDTPERFNAIVADFLDQLTRSDG
ncbi:MAG: alpha/beta hydrolase [Ilumatobacteraceae bacterium]